MPPKAAGSRWLPLAVLALALAVTPPATGASFANTGSMATTRIGHTATLLQSGKVLVVGGVGTDYLASAELYDPTTGTWTGTGSLPAARYGHTATLLPNGKVLVVGGTDSTNARVSSAQLYDPAAGTWMATGSLAIGDQLFDATKDSVCGGRCGRCGGSPRNRAFPDFAPECPRIARATF